MSKLIQNTKYIHNPIPPPKKKKTTAEEKLRNES